MMMMLERERERERFGRVWDETKAVPKEKNDHSQEQGGEEES